ncbi:hypothetical protein D3C77_154650 [compost metagenome]
MLAQECTCVFFAPACSLHDDCRVLPWSDTLLHCIQRHLLEQLFTAQRRIGLLQPFESVQIETTGATRYLVQILYLSSLIRSQVVGDRQPLNPLASPIPEYLPSNLGNLWFQL